MIKDMTTGIPSWKLISFAIPIFISTAFTQLQSVFDTAIVGQILGMRELAAIGATNSVTFLFSGFIGGIVGATTMTIAKYFGTHNQHKMRQSICMAAYIMLIFVTFISGLGIICSYPLLETINTPAELMPSAHLYMCLSLGSMIFTQLSTLLSCAMNAMGDSTTSLVFLIATTLFNSGLDYLFIKVFSFGIAGIVLASVISKVILSIIFYLYMRKKSEWFVFEKQDFQWDSRIAKDLLKLGIPIGFQSMGISIGSVILQSGVNTLSTAVISGYTIGTKVEGIIVSPMAIFGSTIGTYIGQNYGAKNFPRLRRGFWIIFRWELVASIVCFGVVQLFGWNICELFVNVNGEESVPYAFQYISTISFFFPLLCLVHIYTNSQKGIGNGLASMTGGTFELIARILVSYLLVKEFGYSAVCMASPFAWVGSIIAMCPWFHYKLKKMDQKEKEVQKELSPHLE